jgi:GTP-binding protein EngB required for normal cell division
MHTELREQVVKEILMIDKNNNDDDESKNPQQKKPKNRQTLSRPERKALERNNNNNNNNSNNNNKRRKHNYAERRRILQAQKQPFETKFELHSQRIPELTIEATTTEDVLRSIKRAQNMHDVHDLRIIAEFLILLKETQQREQVPEAAGQDGTGTKPHSRKQTKKTTASGRGGDHVTFLAYGYEGSLWSRLAVAALHVGAHDLAAIAMTERQRFVPPIPAESAAIVRGLLRTHNVTEAWDVLERELFDPKTMSSIDNPNNRDRDTFASSTNSTMEQEEQQQRTVELIRHRASSLASISSRHYFEGEPVRACAAMEKLARFLASTPENVRQVDIELPWTRILEGATQCQSRIRKNDLPYTWENSQVTAGNIVLPVNVVHPVLNAILAHGKQSTDDDRIYELLSNALLRRIVFVTGAVELDQCPESDGRGEVCFIGRSNVGKSSLINMIANRKGVAFTSKRPGKTQQFNYFAVNDAPDLEKFIQYGDEIRGKKDADCFYIVDAPGFGYAKVPENVRQSWLVFLHEYMATRENLRVIFHLVDSRLGPTDEDKVIFQQVADTLKLRANSSSSVRPKYVVVLTKADKNVKGATDKKRRGVVRRDIVKAVDDALESVGIGRTTPVIVSSAETKLGRDAVWNYLRLAAEVPQ